MGSERAIRRRGRQPLRFQQIRALVEPARGGVAGRGAAEPAAAQRQAAGTGGAPARLGVRGPRRRPHPATRPRATPPIPEPPPPPPPLPAPRLSAPPPLL